VHAIVDGARCERRFSAIKPVSILRDIDLAKTG
jgi:hypothetical protein